MSNHDEHDFPGGHHDGRIVDDFGRYDDEPERFLDDYATFILVALIVVATIVGILGAFFFWAGRH